jgi:hypothetical protein
MKTMNSLLLLLGASLVAWAQQSPPKPTAPIARCHGCVHRVVRRVPSLTPAPPPQPPAEFFVGEARVDVTKDETVVRLAMAQHGSVLIELPANDGPRYIIPGDPEMATVDQKALERNKRAIVVRPGTQFVPPLRNLKARTPSATVTAQMRSGLVVTFLFYPVEDLAQNVHRCVLNYNRDEVVARRRAAGLPVNLDGTGERGEMTAQSAAPISISVEDSQEEKEKKVSLEGPASSVALEAKAADKGEINSTNVPLAAVSDVRLDSKDKAENPKESNLAAISALNALQEAVKRPKQFKNWTKPMHGLSLSILQPSTNAQGFNLVLVAVRNKTSESLKLTPDIPDLFIEMLDDHGKRLNIESIKKLHTEASDSSGFISKGGTVYYAVAYASPVLNVHQQVRVSVGQTSAADEPASIILVKSER